jgi:hypothetical protein
MQMRRTALIALASLLLTACVVEQPAPPAARSDPHRQAVQRYGQVNSRIANEHRLIDSRVNQGYYPPPAGGGLHRRLDQVQREASGLASQHGGGLSGDEQRVLNEELNAIAADFNR